MNGIIDTKMAWLAAAGVAGLSLVADMQRPRSDGAPLEAVSAHAEQASAREHVGHMAKAGDIHAAHGIAEIAWACRRLHRRGAGPAVRIRSRRR